MYSGVLKIMRSHSRCVDRIHRTAYREDMNIIYELKLKELTRSGAGKVKDGDQGFYNLTMATQYYHTLHEASVFKWLYFPSVKSRDVFAHGPQFVL